MSKIWNQAPRLYFFPCSTQLNEIYPAHKCENANNNVSILTFISMIHTTPERLKSKKLLRLSYFSFMSSWSLVLSWVEHGKNIYSLGRFCLFACSNEIEQNHISFYEVIIFKQHLDSRCIIVQRTLSHLPIKRIPACRQLFWKNRNNHIL